MPTMWDVDLGRPMGSWRKAWALARKEVKVRYRWHDLRHTFISRLAENPVVSEQTIRALAGHVSRQKLECYSHIRSQAKQAAIQALDNQVETPVFEPTSCQIHYTRDAEKGSEGADSLETNGGPARI
jgi:hypothetical protein